MTIEVWQVAEQCEALYIYQERVAIKMDSGIPQAAAERQALEEREARL